MSRLVDIDNLLISISAVFDSKTAAKVSGYIKDYPTVDNHEWVSVSARTPVIEYEMAKNERGDNAVFPVLATIQKRKMNGELCTTVNRAYFFEKDKEMGFYDDGTDKVPVIAWMPLPESYKPD